MNILKMSAIDKAIIRQCGKNTRERYETHGISLKKTVVNWLVDNNYDVEDLKYSLITLKINEKKILCSISTCTADRNNKNFTVGVEIAENYRKDNDWFALFAEIDGDRISWLGVINCNEVIEIAKEYTRSRGTGTYYACNYNDVIDKSESFDEWVKKMYEEGVEGV